MKGPLQTLTGSAEMRVRTPALGGVCGGARAHTCPRRGLRRRVRTHLPSEAGGSHAARTHTCVILEPGLHLIKVSQAAS